MFFPCDETESKSAHKLNRVLRRKEEQEVQARAMANLAQREGEQIQAHVWKKAELILEDHGFNTDGSLTDQEKAFKSIEHSDATLDHEVVCHMIEELNGGQAKEKHIELSELRETFEDPSAVKANISIDDVCCKKQKASGRKRGSRGIRKTRDGVQHRGSYPKQRIKDVYIEYTHYLTNDDDRAGVSLVEWTDEQAGISGVFHRWSTRFAFSHPEYLWLPFLQNRLRLVPSGKEM